MESVILTGLADKKYLFRLPMNVAGVLANSGNEFEEVDGFEVYPELLEFHNTMQEIGYFISEYGFDLFIGNNYCIKINWLIEV